MKQYGPRPADFVFAALLGFMIAAISAIHSRVSALDERELAHWEAFVFPPDDGEWVPLPGPGKVLLLETGEIVTVEEAEALFGIEMDE